jgi:Carboxypeptidase regulatory-like domain
MKRMLVSVLVFLAIASAAVAQTFRGGINGIVTDQTGAILPGADVKATNDATGLSYSTTSSTAGAFTFADLPLGDYTIGDSRGSPGIGPGEPFNMQLALKVLF